MKKLFGAFLAAFLLCTHVIAAPFGTNSGPGRASSGMNLNGDISSIQTLVTGTSGTDFAISSPGSGVHTFNLPTASATNRGALSSADWSTFNSKQAAITVLDIAHGGTNSGTALSNNRVIVSASGAIQEASAITASRVLVSDSNGIPTHSSTTTTTLGYLDVSSSLTTLLAAKAPLASPTFTGTVTLPSGSVTSSAWTTGSSTLTVGSPSSATGTNFPVGFITVKSDGGQTTGSDGLVVIGDGVQSKVSAIAYGTSNKFRGYRAQGTASSPTAVASASLSNFEGYGYDGSAFDLGGYFTVQAGTTWSGSDHETYLVFGGTASGSTTPGTIGTWRSTGITAAGLNLSGLTATTVPYLDGSKNFASSAVTPTELGYLSGVTSAVQTQLNTKVEGKGNGANTRVAYWTDANTLSSSGVWVFTPATFGSVFQGSNSGGNVQFQISNTSATASSAAVLRLDVASTSGGDALVKYASAGSTVFSHGIDSSDSNAFKVSASATLGTTDMLDLYTDGTVYLGNSTLGGVVTFSGATAVARRDTNGQTMLQVRNDNAGSSAHGRLAVSSDQGDVNLVANSGAGGDSVQLNADSAFSGGFQIGILGTNALSLRTNGTDRIKIQTDGHVDLYGPHTVPLVVKSAISNAQGLLLYANTGTDVASIVNYYSAALEFGAANTVYGSVSSGGAWTFGASGGSQGHQVNGLLTVLQATGPMMRIKDGGTAGTDANPYFEFRDGSAIMGQMGFPTGNSKDMVVNNSTDTGDIIFQTNNTSFGTLNESGKWTLGASGGSQTHVLRGDGVQIAASSSTNTVTIARADSTGVVSVSGDSGAAGGEIRMYGSSHASTANQIRFYNNGTLGGTLNAGSWTLGSATTNGFTTVNGRGIDVNYSTSGVTGYFQITHSQNTSGSGAGVYLSVAGASAGDAFISFNSASESATWTAGLDNSIAGNPFVIGFSSALGSNDAFSIDGTTLASRFLGRVGVLSAPSTSAHLLVGGTSSLSTTTQYGIQANSVLSSSATVGAYGIASEITFANASFTVPFAIAFGAANISAVGGTATITRAVSYYSSTQSNGATGNAVLADNVAFSGNYFINSTSTNPSLLSGVLNASAGVRTKYSTANVTDGAPTAAEMASACGTASSGLTCVINDANGGTSEFFVWSDGTNWFYVAGTKGL